MNTIVSKIASALLFAFFAAGALAGSVTYTYDDLGRLWTVTTSDGRVTTYGLDAAGNRTIVTTTIPGDTTPPSAPGTPTITGITATTATATWTAATDNVAVTNYEYQLNGGTWTSAGNVLTINLSSLTPSTAYTFSVRARDAAANTGAATSAAFSTPAVPDTTPPLPPGTPTFSAIAPTSATASWGAATDNVGVTGYEYSLNGGASWIAVGNVTSIGLTGLSSSTAYTFSVRAFDAAGNRSSASSGSFTTTTAPDTTPPGPPGTPSFSAVTVSSATVSWTAATDNVGVTAYRYSVNGGTWNVLGNVLSVGLTGLSSATNYTIAVQASDAAGNWGGSASNSFTTLDGTVPGVPGAPAFSAVTGTSATVTWTAATDNVGVTAYDYQINSNGWVAVGNVLTTNLTGLTNATSYPIQIRARDAAGNIGPASSAVLTTPDTAAPNPPGAPTFSAITGTSATVSWTAATDNVGVTTYDYQINSNGWVAVGNVLTTGIGGLTGSTSYTIQIRARDAAGNASTASSAVLTTADTTPPTAPGIPTFSGITASSATISWSAATDNIGVTGYEYSFNAGASWTSVGNVLSTTVTGLTIGTRYDVVIRAKDAAGNGGALSPTDFFFTSAYITDTTTLVDAVNANGTNYGFILGVLGSMTPATTSNGFTYQSFTDKWLLATGTYNNTKFSVSGFATDPTDSWLGSAECGGASPSGARTYSFVGNTATWTWTSGVIFSGGNFVETCHITHK